MGVFFGLVIWVQKKSQNRCENRCKVQLVLHLTLTCLLGNGRQSEERVGDQTGHWLESKRVISQGPFLSGNVQILGAKLVETSLVGSEISEGLFSMNTSLTRRGERNAQKGVFLKVHLAAVVRMITGQNATKIGIWEREGVCAVWFRFLRATPRHVSKIYSQMTKMTKNCRKHFSGKIPKVVIGIRKLQEICEEVVRQGFRMFVGSARLTLIVVNVGPLGCTLAKVRANCLCTFHGFYTVWARNDYKNMFWGVSSPSSTNGQTSTHFFGFSGCLPLEMDLTLEMELRRMPRKPSFPYRFFVVAGFCLLFVARFRIFKRIATYPCPLSTNKQQKFQ